MIWGTEISYSRETSAAVDIFFIVLLFLRGLNLLHKHESKQCSFMGRSHMSSPYHTSQAAKMTTDFPILSHNADDPKLE